jgi:hypothetical protein
MVSQKIGRNSNCPCGSGKKYKHCCLLKSNENGGLYVNVLYPGYIALEEKVPFWFEIQNRKTVISVYKHLEPLEILDFTNNLEEKKVGDKYSTHLAKEIRDISREGIVIKGGGRFLKVVETDHVDKTKIFTPRYFTELMISYEVSDINNLTSEDDSLFEDVLDQFIIIYREVTKDCRVKRPCNLNEDNFLVRFGIAKYDDSDLKSGLEERLLKSRQVNFGIKTIKYEKSGGSTPKPDPKDEKVFTSLLKNFINEKMDIKDVNISLAKAYEELLINKNFNYTLLDAFIAAETLVTDFLYKEKVKRGVSKKKLDNYKTEIGVSYLLNVDLPLLIDNIDDQKRQIIGNVDKVRKLRNDFVHNGRQVSEKEALDALNYVLALVKMLNP